MAWTTGATGAFPENLKIQGDMVAYVKMVAEPEVWEKDEDDKRPHIKCEYLGGDAVAAAKEIEAHPAEVGEIYTLWMGKTLSGAILQALGWREGRAAPSIEGTAWKIWRTTEMVGGNRLYAASKMEGEDIQSDAAANLAKKLEAGSLMKTLRTLTKLDHETWKTFLAGEGVVDPDAATAQMVELGYITTDDKNVYPAAD
jgi:hypothetical protein